MSWSMDVSHGSVARVSSDFSDLYISSDRDPRPPRICDITATRISLCFPNRLDPQLCLDKAWLLLKPAIRIIFLDEQEYFSRTEIVKALETAWSAKSGEDVYKLILEECGLYLSKDIQSLEGTCDAEDDPSVFLSLMEKCWLEFNRKMSSLFVFVRDQRIRGVGSLSYLGSELFSKRLCLASKLRDRLISTILLLIKEERSGKAVDLTRLEVFMHMFDAGLPSFKKPFLQCPAEFYKAEVMQVLEQSDLPHYLKHVEKRLREEKQRCKQLYFFDKFEDQLISLVHRTFLRDHVSAILEKGFVKLMDERCDDDLKRLYDLFSEAKLVAHLNKALSSYMLETGRKILAQGSSLAWFKIRVEQIWLSHFLEDQSLEKTIERSYKSLGFSWKVLETPPEFL